jgi:hypothetical protein
MPEPLGMFAKRLLARSDQFLAVFRKITDPMAEPHVAYHLLSHALELLLKAHLASVGVDKATLKDKLRHNLEAILKRCALAGLLPVTDLDNLVGHLQLMNSDQDLRYPTAFRLKAPTPPECLVVMEALRSAVAPVVQRSHFDDRLRLAGDAQLRGKEVIWSD